MRAGIANARLPTAPVPRLLPGTPRRAVFPYPRIPMQRWAILIIIAVGALAIYSSTFIVDQTEFAIEIVLGEPTRVIKEPGLYFRLPFITDISKVDNRLLTYDSSTGTIITRDKKTMLMDNFAKWRVADPLKFYESVRNERGAISRLDDIIYSQMREILGKKNLEEIVTQRGELMGQVTTQTQSEAGNLGILVADVRIKRADLPAENSRAVYGRMEAERRRVAKRYLSEGEQEALKIRSGADREKATLLAEATRKSAIIRGDADAEAAKIYADAYKQDAEFYRFIRSMEMYRKSFEEDTTLVLSDKDRETLKYFR